MLQRIVVPTDAKISREQPGEQKARIRPEALVPRSLAPDGGQGGAPPIVHAEGSGAQNKFVVPKLIVPTDAVAGVVVSSPFRPGQKDMFLEAILPEAPMEHRRSPGEWLISVGIHAAILLGLVALPLFFTQKIGVEKLESTFLLAPLPPPAAPPPAPAAVAARPKTIQRAAVPAGKLTMPVAIPRAVRMVHEESYEQADPGVPEGVVGGIPGGQIGTFGGILSSLAETSAPAAPVAPPIAAPSNKPLHVGGDVKAPKPLYTPQPKYPALAMQARITGDVKIEAMIDEEGNVVDAHVASGPALLISAALEAVKHWKYQPTYLNGKPYPLELEIHVAFALT